MVVSSGQWRFQGLVRSIFVLRPTIMLHCSPPLLFCYDVHLLLNSGYVDFWNTDACEKAASLNGKNLLGRPIRIDWAE